MSVDGTWNITMQTPLGARTGTITLSTASGGLTGTMSGEAGATEIADGAVDGNTASWKADITDPMALTLEFSATVDGDTMTGSVKLGMFGNAPLTGTRA